MTWVRWRLWVFSDSILLNKKSFSKFFDFDNIYLQVANETFCEIFKLFDLWMSQGSVNTKYTHTPKYCMYIQKCQIGIWIPFVFLNECRNPKAFAWVHKFVINVLIVAIAHVDEKGGEVEEADSGRNRDSKWFTCPVNSTSLILMGRHYFSVKAVLPWRKSSFTAQCHWTPSTTDIPISHPFW